MRMRAATGAAVLVLMTSVSVGMPARAAVLDCTGPPGEPAPGTLAWHERELANAACAAQRATDSLTNPAYLAAALEQQPTARSGYDPFRDPSSWSGARGRSTPVTFTTGPFAATESATILLPCDATCTGGPSTFAPPYPAIVVAPGSGTYPEMYLWATQGLAEAGYLVMAMDVNEGQAQAFVDALDFLTSEVNPHREELDPARIGLAGHSSGATAAGAVGQRDPRVSAIVAWDNLSALSDVTPVTPALGINADPELRQNGVFVPAPQSSPPDADARNAGFRSLRDAGVDAMQIALRAGTHLEFSRGLWSSGSRLGERVAFHYTLAWFDRYLRPGLAADALARLRAPAFDDSADRSNISAGAFVAGDGNAPFRIEGMSVADRLSYHFRSSYFLDGGAYACVDVRAGC